MLKVSKVAERLDRLPAHGDCAVIRPGAMRLMMLQPGTRGMPHFHAGHETALYVVSGETEVWHGRGLTRRLTVRAGDFLSIPAGAPHLAVNRTDVTSIAVAARGRRADDDRAVVIDMPGHLAGLLSLPVARE